MLLTEGAPGARPDQQEHPLNTGAAPAAVPWTISMTENGRIQGFNNNPPRVVQQSSCSPWDLYSFPVSEHLPVPHLLSCSYPTRMDLKDFSSIPSKSAGWALGVVAHSDEALLTTRGQRLCVKYDSRKGKQKVWLVRETNCLCQRDLAAQPPAQRERRFLLGSHPSSPLQRTPVSQDWQHHSLFPRPALCWLGRSDFVVYLLFSG